MPYRFQHLKKKGDHTHIHPSGRREHSTPGHILVVEDYAELKGASDKFVPLDEPPKPELFSTSDLKIQKRGSRGPWYDVIRVDTGKPINDRALNLEDAHKLIANWNPESALGSGSGSGSELDPPLQNPAASGAPANPDGSGDDSQTPSTPTT